MILVMILSSSYILIKINLNIAENVDYVIMWLAIISFCVVTIELVFEILFTSLLFTSWSALIPLVVVLLYYSTRHYGNRA